MVGLTDKKIYADRKFVAIIATLCCLLWGSAFPAVKIGYELFNIDSEDIASKILFAGYRFLTSGIIVLIIAKVLGKNIFKMSRKDALGVSVLGITQTTLQYIFFYTGLANTTGVKGSIVYSTGTFFSVVLAHYVYKNDKLDMQKTIGCALGLIGVMIANFSSDLLNVAFSFNGEGFVIIAALIFSITAIYSKRLTKSIDVMVITGYNLFIGGLLLIISGVVFGGRVNHFTVSSSTLLIYMALLSAVAFSFWTLLLKYNKVGKVSVFSFLNPIFGVILSSIVLGENILELKTIFSLLLVCLGIWIVNKEKDIGKENKIQYN